MEQITINLLATGITPVCHVSQFDDGRTIRINLKKGADVFTLSGTEEVKMRIRKPDDTERIVDIVNTSSSYVDYVSSPEDCDIEGVNVCELVVGEAGSKNFLMNVEEDAYGGGADIETLSASGPIATFETNMVDNLVDLKAEITPTQDLHGYDYPWPAGGGKNKCSMPNTTFEQFAEVEIDEIPAGSYEYSAVITSTDTDSDKCAVIFLDAEKNTLTSKLLNRSVGTSRTSTTLTVSSPIKFLRLYAASGYPSGAGDTASFVDNMICLQSASNPTVFEPYENICPISGHDSAQLFRTGKNLLDKESYEWISNSNIIFGGTNTTISDSLILSPGTYTLSCSHNVTGFYVDNHDGIVKRAYNTSSTTFSISSRQAVRINFYIAGVTRSDLLSFDYQLELGSTATDYVAYNGNEYVINLGGTYYGAELMIDKYGHRTLKVVDGFKTFTGSASENWYYYAVDTGSLFRIGVSERKSGYITSTMANANAYLCNQATKATNNTYGRTNGTFSGGGHNLDVVNNNFTSLASWKTYLASNPLQFKYELETPIIIDLPDGEPIEALLGINNVYANTGDVELKYLKQV